MLTARNLLMNRIIRSIRFQLGVWRTAIDWTVALYLVIPGLILAGYEVWSWWQALPAWAEALPAIYLYSPLVGFVVSGTLRCYYEEADQLFLFQHRSWMRTLLVGGMLYTVGVRCLGLAAAALIVAPLVHAGIGLSVPAAIRIYVTAVLANVLFMLVKQMPFWDRPGWFSGLRRTMVLAVGGMLFYGIAHLSAVNAMVWSLLLFGLVLALGVALRARLNRKGSLMQDIRREQRARLKWVALLLSLADADVAQPRNPRRRPWWFRNSGRLFRKADQRYILAESIVKASLRNRQKWNIYGSVLAAYAFALLAVPTDSIRFALWMAFAFLMAYMARLFVKEGMGHPFIRMFPWPDRARFGVIPIACAALSMPGYMLLTIWIGVILRLAVWQWLLVMPAGMLLNLLAARLMGFQG